MLIFGTTEDRPCVLPEQNYSNGGGVTLFNLQISPLLDQYAEYAHFDLAAGADNYKARSVVLLSCGFQDNAEKSGAGLEVEHTAVHCIET